MTFATFAGKQKQQQEQPQLQFRGSGINCCDCDECENIPLEIRELYHKRKRQLLETGPIKRTLQRTFVNRQYVSINDDDNGDDSSITATTNNKSGTVSVYSMTLPVDAEPLVEFGTSHRIVWIKLLSSSSTTNQNSTTASTSTLSTIGKGIIGSRDEQTTRTILTDWTEGQIILVPSTEGTASGWIHTKQQQQEHHPETPPKSKRLKGSTVTNTVGGRDTSPTDSSSSSATTTTGTGRSGGSAYAVMYVAKIPKGLIESTTPTEKTNHNTQNNSFPLESDSSSWASTLIEYCRKGLLLSTRPLSHQQEEQEHDHSATSNTPSPTTATTTTKSKEYYIFSKEDAAKIKLVFCQAEEAQSRQERYR